MAKERKTVNQIIEKAKEFNFKPRKRTGAGGISMTICEACRQQAIEEYGDTWKRDSKGTMNRAVILDGEQATVLACPCGWRRFIPNKNNQKTVENKPKKPIKFTNKCIKEGCNNDLPKGRKSYCYSCRKPPKAKEGAQAQK